MEGIFNYFGEKEEIDLDYINSERVSEISRGISKGKLCFL